MKVKRIIITLALLFSVTALFAWKAGDRILGKWDDGNWYPAKITSAVGENFKVAFDDGDASELQSGRIKKLNWKVGTKVECKWKNGAAYYSGTITSIKGESIHISYDDGDQEDNTISICREK